MGKFIMNGVEYTGGGEGSSTLAELSDTDITTPADGETLRYNGTSGKWENAAPDISPFSVVNGAVNITYTTT